VSAGVAPSPAAAYPCVPFPVDLVLRRGRTDGGREALVDLAGARRTVSYAELADRVQALADGLRRHGIGPDRPVAVLLERSADTVVAMLAVLAAGGVYCPLDPGIPAPRLAAVLDRLRPAAAIADAPNAPRLPAGTAVVRPDGTGPADAEIASAAPADPDSTAYILFTSGSTGVPKAVAMSRRGLSRLIRWQLADGAPGLRTLQFTATSFDVTFQEVLSTLASGGSLVLVPEETRRDPAALLETIVGERVQRLFLPYVALQLLAVAAARAAAVPSSLEHVITAGERLVVTPAIRELFAAVPHCRLDNHYGPTEAHLVTSLTLPAGVARWPAVPAIGAPVDGVVCRVLDERLAEVPDGGVGELYVAGTGLAAGYLRDPAQSAQRFVPDPFAAEPGQRLYRTGDLVRADAEGGYEFLGRGDGQLKVRGFRVEPAEVESALLSHPRVEAAAVGLREVADGVSVLTAYVQSRGPVVQRQLSDHLRGLLPAYMVPSRYVAVAAMPRTASGKVDGSALAALPLEDPSAAQAPELAREGPADTPAAVTEIIRSLWTRVLGHDEFEDDDDFFDVGGDSLLATWVVAELGQAIEQPVKLSLFLEHGTVEELAEALGPVGPSAAGPAPSQLVTLRQGPSGRSVLLVHPLGGELLCYRDLARAVRAPVRLLGLGWSGQPPEFGTPLAEIARVHVAQLRTVQPEGPYRLAGWSFGGVLAYEMAQQLIAAGAEVDFLGLLDANPVLDPITGLPMAETPFLGLLDDVVARLADPDVSADELAELTRSETWLQLMGVPITAGASSPYLRAVLDTARACMAAAMAYRPEKYPGPVLLVQAEREQERGARLAGSIRELCAGECTLVAAPGDHWGFIRAEHAAATARELDSALERVGSTTSTARSATHGS